MVATRRITKTATVSLEANQYAVDPALVGRRVELRYDPADLSVIEVFCQGKASGVATPFIIGRHTHRAGPTGGPAPGAVPTGVDYLGLVAAAHDAEAVGSISFAQPPSSTSTPRTGMSRAPWVAHFGLARTPFSKSIAAKDLYARAAHGEAVARIGFCVAEAALGVVFGDVGVGKTVAVRAAVAGLDPTRHQIIYIPNPAFGTRGLYVSIVRALGADARFHKAELMAQAADLLAAEEAERHRRVVVIVDEAHLMTPPSSKSSGY